jgi:SAM-dependent methyltransferase
MSDITVSDLEIMSSAVNYRGWLFEQVAAYRGRRVLEVGAGIGNYTVFLADAEQVVSVDVHAGALAVLRGKYAGDPRVAIHQADIADPSCRALASYRCDSAICFNVLEHVEDHVGALRNVAAILVPGGRLLLIVPALPFIYGTVDRSLCHYRRYTPASLRAALGAAGYTVERLWWMNFPGIFGWFLNNRVLRRREESAAQIQFYDRFIVPWLRRVESVLRPPVGLSLVCVARTPVRQSAAA